MKQFQQCLLKQGNCEQTAWIESRGAKVGALVELLPSRDLWQVAKVYSTKLPDDQLKELNRMHRNSLLSIEPMGAPAKAVGKL